MTITSGSFAKDLYPGVSKWYGHNYGKWEEIFSQIFEYNKSTRAWEEDMGVAGLGYATVKTEGNSITYEDMNQTYLDRYVHTTLGLGFIITREALEDGIAVTKAMAKAKSLAWSMRVTKEVRGANILNRAFTSTYAYGDGKELCATDHPHYSGGTWRNELSTAADLSEAALEQACIDIDAFADDKGLLIAVKPRKLIVPPGLRFEAARILQSVGRSGTADNDINAIKTLGMFPDGVLVNPYLTDADAWFIKTDCPEGLKYYERRKMEFKTEDDFDTENAKFKATERYSFGCTDKRGIFASPGA